MTRLLDDGRFFFPGPTEVRAEILAAMVRPMIPHRGPEFERLFEGLEGGLRRVFRTRRPVFISSSSATGLMEAGVRSAPPGTMLALVNGAFSERFAQVARSCGRSVEVLAAEWGQVVPLDAVEARLKRGRVSAVTVVHSETSTGALTDVREVQALATRHGAVCLVDSVSGIGGLPVETDGWGLDYVFTGSQKALALPPGLAFAVASEAFVAGAAQDADRGLYFDLVAFEAFAGRSQTPNTPALPLFFALEAQLRAMAEEGLEARWSRHAAMQARVEGWVDTSRTPLGILAPAGARAATVTALTLPPGVSGKAVAGALGARGYVIGAGYGKLGDSTIRIGHMGDHTVAGLDRCLAQLTAVLGTE